MSFFKLVNLVLYCLLTYGCSSRLSLNNTLYPVQEGKKWGLMNSSGEVVVPFIYDGNHYGYTDGLISMRKGNKWCFLDESGKEIIAPLFTSVNRFREGLCAVSKGKGYGLINKKGEWVIEPFTKSSFFGVYNGLTEYRIGERWTFKNLKGEQAFPKTFLRIHSFNEGLAGVKDLKSGLWGVINTEGEYVIKPQFYQLSLYGFNEGLCGAYDSKTGKWGFIDKTGAFVIKAQFDQVFHFSEGLCGTAAGVDDETGFNARRWGFIDKKGMWRIEPKYELVWNFKEGLCKAVLNENWGFVDSDGKEVVPFIYDNVEHYYNGLAKVERSTLYKGYQKYFAYINKKGEYVWKPSNFNKVEALIEEEASKKPSINVQFSNKLVKDCLQLPERVKISASGQNAGRFSAEVKNRLGQDVFLRVNDFELKTYKIFKENGSNRFSSGGRGPYESLYKLFSKERHDGLKCGCQKQFINGSIAMKKKDLVHWVGARGVLWINIDGYYRSNGESFYERIKLPIEIVK